MGVFKMIRGRNSLIPSWRRGVWVCLLAMGCGSGDFVDFSSFSTQNGQNSVVQTAPITLRVAFAPPPKALGKVLDSTQFTVTLLDPVTGQVLLTPTTFERTPPSTQQQTVMVQAPRGSVSLVVSFLQDGLLVGVSRTLIDTTQTSEFSVEARELFRPLAGPNVSAQQRRPRVAGHPAGFVAAWAGLTPAGGPQTNEVFARRYSAPGFQAEGDEFQVNTVPVGNEAVRVDVGADAQGNFLLVWDGFNAASNSLDIFGRRFGNDGLPLGAPFVVNSDLVGEQTRPRLSMDSSGQAVVAWLTTDGGNTSVRGRHFNAQGNPVSGDRLVATPAANPFVTLIHSGGNLPGWVVGYDQNTHTYLEAFSSDWTSLGRLEESGIKNAASFSSDTSLFLTYTSGVDVDERARVNYYRFDPVLGILPQAIGGQMSSPLGLDGQSQSFSPSGSKFSNGACYTYTTIHEGERKQIVTVQNLTTGQFFRPQSLALKSAQVAFALLVVGGDSDAFMVSTLITAPEEFDLSVFGFEPQTISAATD